MTDTVGCVDERIRFVLDTEKLSATHWLGDFEDEDIKLLEHKVRDMELAQFAKLNYKGEQTSFKFNFIEMKCLKCIIAQIKQRGIPYFTKQDKAAGPSNNQTFDDPAQSATILQKITDKVSM